MEQRTRDLEWVSRVRGARISAVAQVASGEPFRHVLRQLRVDQFGGRTYVVALTDVHSCLGKVAGRRLMASIGLEPLVRVDELTDDHIEALSQCCGG